MVFENNYGPGQYPGEIVTTTCTNQAGDSCLGACVYEWVEDFSDPMNVVFHWALISEDCP